MSKGVRAEAVDQNRSDKRVSISYRSLDSLATAQQSTALYSGLSQGTSKGQREGPLRLHGDPLFWPCSLGFAFRDAAKVWYLLYVRYRPILALRGRD